MKIEIERKILKLTNAKKIEKIELVQKLWSDYGNLQRIYLHEGECKSIILKHIKIPKNLDFDGKRKLKSYINEINWYQNYNNINLSSPFSATPKLIEVLIFEDEYFILLEDLLTLSFSKIVTYPTLNEIKLVINWLASFHSKFIGIQDTNLWENGSYWHLKTRPDEFNKIENEIFKDVAKLVDLKLHSSKFKTIIHGDAKLANFCFNKTSSKVAGVDFQYCGHGVGIIDLAYFFTSCLDNGELIKYEKELIDYYFFKLMPLIPNEIDKIEFEKNWRELYYFAICDFHRFLLGWNPKHYKINNYSKEISNKIQKKILDQFLEMATLAAESAGKIAMKYFKTNKIKSMQKEGNEFSSVLTQVDILAQEKIIDTLMPLINEYNLTFLSEEIIDSKERFEKDFFWCIDPIDGTYYFEKGKPGFAISIALVNQKGHPIIAVIYNPYENKLYSSIKGQGVKINHSKILKDKKNIQIKQIILFADLSLKESKYFNKIKEHFDIIFNSGAVLNCMQVLENKNSCYFKFPKNSKGGGAIWDFAAASLILEEYGNFITDFNLNKLRFNEEKSVYFNYCGIKVSHDNKTQLFLEEFFKNLNLDY